MRAGGRGRIAQKRLGYDEPPPRTTTALLGNDAVLEAHHERAVCPPHCASLAEPSQSGGPHSEAPRYLGRLPRQPRERFALFGGGLLCCAGLLSVCVFHKLIGNEFRAFAHQDSYACLFCSPRNPSQVAPFLTRRPVGSAGSGGSSCLW